MALHTVVYLSLLGDDGLREAAMQGLNGAHYLASQQGYRTDANVVLRSAVCQ